MRLVFASNNAHKLAEVRQIMPAGTEVLSLQDIGFESEIDETGTTLEANSLIKAQAVNQWLIVNRQSSNGQSIDGVFADDTGLEIDALGGQPGVYTARWYKTDEGQKVSGEKEIFAANRAKALRELAGQTNREAQFRTVITLIKASGEQLAVNGVVRGRIAEEEYGQGGFGYDPVFIPEGYDKTFGELPASIKNHISHRARALAELVKVLKHYIPIILFCFLLVSPLRAEAWRSHLAYNNVTQIAMTPDKVYALSDGSLFSVDKQTEKIRIYDRQSGLHGANITCIGYDTQGDQLVIGYGDGKIDLLSSQGTRYISALYEKDMTQRKNIYNITFSGRTAYLSTHYGIQTLGLSQHKLVNSYWLRPGGEETPVQDVVLTQDSIYAFTEDSLFCAALADNIVDYTYWKREKRSERIQPDPEKGRYYRDATDQWYAGGQEGILRQSVTSERLNYKPQSPLSNIPYRMHYAQGRLYVVQGGRWSAQMQRQGMVMIYDGEQWTNIPGDSISPKTGINALDFMNVAVKPGEPKHYFVTSYGTGLYEFDNDRLIRHYLPAEDNTLESTAKGAEAMYTRLDGAAYDKQGNLWMLDAGEVTYPLVCMDAQGVWHGLHIKDDVPLHTPCGLIIDHHRTNYKWIATARYNTTLFLLDDGGTPFDASDDHIIGRNEWLLPDGHNVSPSFIYDMMQSSDGRIWLATEQGVLIIDATDYFESNRAAHPQTTDGNGENPMADLVISALGQDKDGNIWVGTNTMGAYVLNADATEITAHYTTDNSAMPSNAVLSFCPDENGNMFIGTGNGLVEYRPNDDPAGSSRTVDDEGRDLGFIMQWKLHLSYSEMEQVVATPERIYARANGSLFYIDRADDQIGYMDKTTGLNGSTVTQIGYDPGTAQLIIGYSDGRIDLVDKNDNVRQMPDLHMKASSVSVTINAISVGKNRTYLAMPFGILVINPKKGEISDTYYIGDEASDVNVLQVMEIGDSIFAVSEDRLYAASMENNLVDFSYWKSSMLPNGKIQQAAVFNNELHLLVDSALYRRHEGQWQKKATRLNWIHASDGQLLTYIDGQGLLRVLDDYSLAGLTANYTAGDAVYTKGEYWLGADNKGLVRLQNTGDAVFTPDGPNSNYGYFLHAAHGRIYATVGGRWSSQYFRMPRVSIYSGQKWSWLAPSNLATYETDFWWYAWDPVSIAVDPNDADHFYIATFCTGVFEYNHGALTRYGDGVNGSSLKLISSDADAHWYTRTDGAMIDEQGNLWVLNATEIGQPVHVMTPDHKWHPLPLRSGGKGLVLTTPTGIWTDRRDSNRKWFIDQRSTQGVILLDDGGTPTVSYDDRCLKRSNFIDQNGRQLSPSYYYCMAQDHNDRIWIGTEAGILIIPESTDFFSSNECHRIIIPRNDGTGLGDYLLANEQINCMAVDGGNRMWIGTAGSGLYLIEDDTITVAHFTENNSMLPSNNILSLAIIPETGEVFAGTDRGIASYLSDASEPNEDMKSAYAYPNPVRPDYGGYVSITGLMENSEVNIIDAGGNLVCKTRSNGGTAVWDLRLSDGKRAKSGIYTALCNTKGGHAAVKIMVIQ